MLLSIYGRHLGPDSGCTPDRGAFPEPVELCGVSVTIGGRKAGLLYVQDAETGEVLLVDSSDPEFRRRLHLLAEDQDDTIGRSVARSRTDLHVVSTEDDLLRAFVRIAASRRRGRR